MKKVAFLDTNLFLHFKQIDEIDWLKELGASEVELLITPVVYRQLDRHKDEHQKRARASVSKLGSLLGVQTSARVREGVTLVLVYEDPRIDFDAHRLSRWVEDDQLIASMLQHRETTSGSSEIVLVTADFLLAPKARAAGFEVVALPIELKLPAAPSEDQKELKKLRQENQRLTTRLPRLRVVFPDRTNHFEVRLQAPRLWSDEVKARKLETYKADHPFLEMPAPKSWPTVAVQPGEKKPRVLLDVPNVMLENVHAPGRRRYNQELQAHFQQYAEYLDRLAARKQRKARSFAFEITLVNEGTLAATDIDIHLEAKAPVHCFEKKDKQLRLPNAPKLPAEPREDFSLQPPGLPLVHLPFLEPSPANFPWNDTTTWDIENGANGSVVITAHVPKLKQGKSETLGPFVFEFVDDVSVGPFSVGYVINSENSPDQEDRLHFVVTREAGSPAGAVSEPGES